MLNESCYVKKNSNKITKNMEVVLDQHYDQKSTNCVDPTRYPRTKEIHARNTTRNPNPTTRGTRNPKFLLLILMFKNTFIRYLLLILDPTQVYTKSRVVTLVPRVNHVNNRIFALDLDVQKYFYRIFALDLDANRGFEGPNPKTHASLHEEHAW